MPGDFRLCQGRISKTICILYKIIVLVDHVACLPLAMFQFENSCPLIPLWRRNNNSVLWSLEGPFWHRDDDGNLCIVQRLAVQFHFLILQLQKLCWWTNLPVDMMNIHLNSYCEYCKWCLIWYIHPPPKKKSSSCNLGLPWLKKTETRWCNNISMYQHRMDSPWGQCNVGHLQGSYMYLKMFGEVNSSCGRWIQGTNISILQPWPSSKKPNPQVTTAVDGAEIPNNHLECINT